MLDQYVISAKKRNQTNGPSTINFTATNYLGFNTNRLVRETVMKAVKRWGTFPGVPRLLATEPLTGKVEKRIARLVGQEIALVFPSTTHIALDVLPLLAGQHGMLFVDAWAYPISWQGVNLAVNRGARVCRFPHNSYQYLANLLSQYAEYPRKVIICDGLYPADGSTARLREFNWLANKFDAVIYIDDAHGIGILGEKPTRLMPYGYGGGGIPRYLGITPGHIVHIGSLSKAFSAPVAFVSGPKKLLESLQLAAPTFIHSSPPSTSDLAAAQAALHVNESDGNRLRYRLLNLVRLFRTRLRHAGFILSHANHFPIQSLLFNDASSALIAAQRLRRNGIWPVTQLHPPENPQGGALRFVVSVHHNPIDINKAAQIISHTCSNQLSQN